MSSSDEEEEDCIDCCAYTSTEKTRLVFKLLCCDLIPHVAVTFIIIIDLVLDILTFKSYYEREYYIPFVICLSTFLFANGITAVVHTIIQWKTWEKGYCRVIKAVICFLLDFPFQMSIFINFMIIAKRKLKWVFRAMQADAVETKRIKMLLDNAEKGSLYRENIGSLGSLHRSQEVFLLPTKGQQTQNENEDLTEDKDKDEIDELVENIQSDFLVTRIKLLESLFESAPHLSINMYLIVKYRTPVIVQIASGIVSFLSLVWGIVKFDEEAKIMTYFHHTESYRAPNRIQIPQLIFLFSYKCCLMAVRIIAFIYFTYVFGPVILAILLPHVLGYFIWNFYHRFKRKVFTMNDSNIKQHLLMILINSLLNIFIYFHDLFPSYQSSKMLIFADAVFYYVIYTLENMVLLGAPYVAYHRHKDPYYFYITMACIACYVLGMVLMTVYYFCLHKSKKFIRNRYCRCMQNPNVTVCLDHHTHKTKNVRSDLLSLCPQIPYASVGLLEYDTCRKHELQVSILATPDGFYRVVPRVCILRHRHHHKQNGRLHHDGNETEVSDAIISDERNLVHADIADAKIFLDYITNPKHAKEIESENEKAQSETVSRSSRGSKPSYRESLERHSTRSSSSAHRYRDTSKLIASVTEYPTEPESASFLTASDVLNDSKSDTLSHKSRKSRIERESAV